MKYVLLFLRRLKVLAATIDFAGGYFFQSPCSKAMASLWGGGRKRYTLDPCLGAARPERTAFALCTIHIVARAPNNLHNWSIIALRCLCHSSVLLLLYSHTLTQQQECGQPEKMCSIKKSESTFDQNQDNKKEAQLHMRCY